MTLIILVTVAGVATGACASDGTPGLSSTASSAATSSAPSATAITSASAAGSQAALAVEPTPDSVVATSATSASVAATSTLVVAPIAPREVAEPVTITVLYDNIVTRPGTRADWGFSCLIQGLEKTVLFDTGADAEVLLANMGAMLIGLEEIDVVVLSHDHGDHTGGLGGIVAGNPDVTVYYPASFAQQSVAPAREAGATLVPSDSVVSPCPGLTVTAPTGDPAESAVLIETAEGMVLVTGCAHPGIAEMVASAVDLAGHPVFAVLGGFHLRSQSAVQVDHVGEGLEALGVERCGPAHCTGDSATARLREAFAGGFIEMGVGAVLTF